MKSTEKEEDEIVIRKVPSKEEERENFRPNKSTKSNLGKSEPVIAKPNLIDFTEGIQKAFVPETPSNSPTFFYPSRKKTNSIASSDSGYASSIRSQSSVKTIDEAKDESGESQNASKLQNEKTRKSSKESINETDESQKTPTTKSETTRKSSKESINETDESQKTPTTKSETNIQDVQEYLKALCEEIEKQRNYDKMSVRVTIMSKFNRKDLSFETQFVLFNNSPFQKMLDDIKETLNKLFPDVYKSNVTMIISEAYLYVLGLLNNSRIRRFYNIYVDDSFQRYFYGDFSAEIKLSAVVANTSLNIDEDIVKFLLQIVKNNFCANRQNNEFVEEYYLGFKWHEIIECLSNALQKYARHNDQSFKSVKSTSDMMKHLCSIICKICQIGPQKDNEYTICVLNLTKTALKIFKEKFKQKIMRKFKQKESFDSTERDVINCFCNSLNTVGQIHPSHLLKPFFNDICETIFICLNELEEFIKTNIYAVRIVEVLLYCLCNVIKCEMRKDNYLKKKDEIEANEGILWRYYRDCSTSESVKLAAAVSFISIYKTQKFVTRRFKMKEIQIYLKKIIEDMKDERTKEYRGFSFEEINIVMNEAPK